MYRKWSASIRCKGDNSLVDAIYFDTRVEAYNEAKRLENECDKECYIIVEEVDDCQLEEE